MGICLFEVALNPKLKGNPMLKIKEITPDKCCGITGSREKVVWVVLNDNTKFDGTICWDELWKLLQRNVISQLRQ